LTCTPGTTTTGRSPRAQCRCLFSTRADRPPARHAPAPAAGTRTRVLAPSLHRGAYRQDGCATPRDGGAHRPPTRPIRIGGQRTSAHSYPLPSVLRVRPGRPPSQPRGHPRATGTNGSIPAPRTGAGE
jgi:hypothetical protein